LLGRFKINAMLCSITSTLGEIPFKRRRHELI
jgi:hypothetical protein